MFKMGATGIFFKGTAAEAREEMICELRTVLRGEIISYCFVNADDGDTEIYMAVRFPDYNNVVVGEVSNYCYYKKDGEIVYRSEWEFVGAVYRNCPEKILRQLSPIKEILKSGLIGNVEGERGQKWRDDCWAKVAEMKKISKTALKKKAKSRGAIQLKYQNSEGEHVLSYNSVADFKTRGKILKLGNVNLICSCADVAKKTLAGIKKAFVEGAAGFNLYNLTTYGEEKQIALF